MTDAPLVSPLAGKPVPRSRLVNVAQLVSRYYLEKPDPAIASQRVRFGTSGHRGSSLEVSFNETHVAAITQAVCLSRKQRGVDGPMFVGIDTHALSEPALATALEVLAANGVETMVDAEAGPTPTPVISHAILSYNRGRREGLADGIVISPSHNPPEDGGFKYNPTNGGPADVEITSTIEALANDFIARDLQGVRRVAYSRARTAACVHAHDFVTPYVADLANVVDLDAIRAAGVRIGVDPLGGAALGYWGAIFDTYKLSGRIVNETLDQTFSFMTVDWDGKVRMDCSSPYAMARLIGLADQFDVAAGNDTDADRHGIVCPSIGLMPPNAYLTAAVAYLFGHRPGWPARCSVGKTVVSSAMIDRMAAKLGRPLFETPVGFKWFSAGFADGTIGFAGEESAGASFLRRDGSVWTTDKDGLIMALLAAEITAQAGQDPGQVYEAATRDLGRSFYRRIDAPATPPQKARLAAITSEALRVTEFAGEPVTAIQTHAPGDQQPIGGIKVSAADAWFAARPSGTEDIYKIYAESFRSEAHLQQVLDEAQAAVDQVLATDPGGRRAR